MPNKNWILLVLLIPFAVATFQASRQLGHTSPIFGAELCDATTTIDPERPIRGFATIQALEGPTTLIVSVRDSGPFRQIEATADSVCKKGHIINREHRDVRLGLASIAANASVPPEIQKEKKLALASAMQGKTVGFECYAHSPNGLMQCHVSAGARDLGLYQISAGVALFDASIFESPVLANQYRLAQELARASLTQSQTGTPIPH